MNDQFTIAFNLLDSEDEATIKDGQLKLLSSLADLDCFSEFFSQIKDNPEVSSLVKRNFQSPIIMRLMSMISEENDLAIGSLFSMTRLYSSELNLRGITLELLDYLVSHIPLEDFYESVITILSQAMTSSDANERKSGFAVLSIAAESWPEYTLDHFDLIFPLVLTALKDDATVVRECASFALAQFSRTCKSNLLEQSSAIYPLIIEGMDDASSNMHCNLCLATTFLTEELDSDEIEPFLDSLVKKLIGFLQTENPATKEVALAAVSSCALAAKMDFLPFAEQVCDIAQELVDDTKPEVKMVRIQALKLLGTVGEVIGEPVFTPYVNKAVKVATEMLSSEDDELRKCGCTFVTFCVKGIGMSFKKHLKLVVPLIIEVVRESEEALLVKNNQLDMDSIAWKDAFEALLILAETTEKSFFPFYQTTIDLLLSAENGEIKSPFIESQEYAVQILGKLLISFAAAKGILLEEELQPGQVISLPKAVKECVRVVMHALVSFICNGIFSSPVEIACDEVTSILEMLGSTALQLPAKDPHENMGSFLKDSVLSIFREQAACQQNGNDEHGDENDDGLLDHASVVVETMAKILQANFIPIFDEFVQYLPNFYDPTRSSDCRAIVFRCFCHSIKPIGSGAVKYMDVLIPLLLVGLIDENLESTRRNAACCTGIFAECVGSALAPHYPQLVEKLLSSCVRTEEEEADSTVDNVVSALARLISSNPTVFPVSQVLPTLLNALPLRDDIGEGPVIYRCLLDLVSANDKTATELSDQIVSVFGEVLSENSNSDYETQNVAEEFFELASNSHEFKNAMVRYLENLEDEDLKNKIESYAGLNKKRKTK